MAAGAFTACSSAVRSAVLYIYPLAFNPQKALLALCEAGLLEQPASKGAPPVTTRKIDLFSTEPLKPAYLAINAAGTAPSMVVRPADKKEPDVKLTETIDILKFADTGPRGPLGGDKVDRKLVDDLVSQLHSWDGNLWAYTHSGSSVASLIKDIDAYKAKFAQRERERAEKEGKTELANVYASKLKSMEAMRMRTSDAVAIKQNEDELDSMLDRCEQLLGSGKNFLAGEAYSMADVVLTVVLYRTTVAPGTLEKRPQVG